jgi:hypothetical protein
MVNLSEEDKISVLGPRFALSYFNKCVRLSKLITLANISFGRENKCGFSIVRVISKLK